MSEDTPQNKLATALAEAFGLFATASSVKAMSAKIDTVETLVRDLIRGNNIAATSAINAVNESNDKTRAAIESLKGTVSYKTYKPKVIATGAD